MCQHQQGGTPTHPEMQQGMRVWGLGWGVVRWKDSVLDLITFIHNQ